jgi:hypothetical protein
MTPSPDLSFILTGCLYTHPSVVVICLIYSLSRSLGHVIITLLCVYKVSGLTAVYCS